MALYKNSAYITASNDTAFDGEHSPGTPAPLSGIYRCLGCGKEDVSTEGNPLPPQNHHQHAVSQGKIRWRLAVWADHNTK